MYQTFGARCLGVVWIAEGILICAAKLDTQYLNLDTWEYSLDTKKFFQIPDTSLDTNAHFIQILQILGVKFQIPQILGAKFQILGAKFQILEARLQILEAKLQILEEKFQILQILEQIQILFFNHYYYHYQYFLLQYQYSHLV